MKFRNQLCRVFEDKTTYLTLYTFSCRLAVDLAEINRGCLCNCAQLFMYRVSQKSELVRKYLVSKFK